MSHPEEGSTMVEDMDLPSANSPEAVDHDNSVPNGELG